MKQQIVQIAGWVGVACVLVGYGLVTFTVISSHSMMYMALNVIGAAGLIVSSLSKKDFQPIVLNAVWLVIAVAGIVIAL
jgi:hypothetical protein